ncbi:sulfite exporter TauE/SafE family protein [Flavobacterium capsici]|uniref:Sulfite exporter TauE/SafE family protein n=1 Tax=Flavobacterium capsici TaxID=3075618 RepID=A0AA96J7X2_9FLAO|nr:MULTISPECIES: sulfite exporter TauE/SafE family protein [unclassified Flavobacterium]WNM20376.1 sulfite exporter TauE/SafE family protein [Flavobacterium sp. PMR2A8]WNM21766.1 sulfite exporter TauE/SafE family protein [Flavobacterium sp. PMTSA4]
MLFTAFIFGLISSLHCIGMCGPIAMMLPVDHKNPTRKALQILTYHFGRITTYALLGLAFGLLGRGLYLAGLQQQISIAVGVLMIVIAIIPERTFAQYNFSKPIYKVITTLKTSLGKQFKKKTLDAMFSIGFLNGLLPCGLVYAALFGAIAMQNVGYSMFYMMLYGLGTIPLMSTVVYASNFISIPWRNQLQKVIPVVMVGLGVLFILRGMGLGIPYISPNEVTLFVQATPQCH